MRWGLTFEVDRGPSAAFLLCAFEEVTRQNVDYFLSEWQAGRDPPCCLGCAEIRYVPDGPHASMRVLGARQVLRSRHVSCGSAAAYEAARLRAKAIASGTPAAQAASMFRVVLEEQPRSDAPQGYYHAVVSTPEGIADPTQEMSR